MAKQTFTSGQVLTAAQMTSLQQTAMLGGAASAKTASYTLVAADAGTAISMSNASATTITVNTSLFAAGDTVQITNLGAGVCTITAGTATVNTSASLALAQYESGTLDFTSTSAAIFIKGAGGAAAGGGMTLINTGGTTLTGASVTISSIPDTYNNLFIVLRNARTVDDGGDPVVQINGDSTANRHVTLRSAFNGSSAFNGTQWALVNQMSNGVSQSLICLTIPDYANATSWKIGSSFGVTNNVTTTTSANYQQAMYAYNQTGAISSLKFIGDAAGWTSGTVFVYGVK